MTAAKILGPGWEWKLSAGSEGRRRLRFGRVGWMTAWRRAERKTSRMSLVPWPSASGTRSESPQRRHSLTKKPCSKSPKASSSSPTKRWQRGPACISTRSRNACQCSRTDGHRIGALGAAGHDRPWLTDGHRARRCRSRPTRLVNDHERMNRCVRGRGPDRATAGPHGSTEVACLRQSWSMGRVEGCDCGRRGWRSMENPFPPSSRARGSCCHLVDER